MKEFTSLKKWTLFSTCVYFGFVADGLTLFYDVLDDLLQEKFVWAGVILFAAWVLLVVASSFYPVFCTWENRGYSLLVLCVNGITATTVAMLVWSGVSPRIEFAWKYSGLMEIVRKVENRSIAGVGHQSLPPQLCYLTRYQGSTVEIGIVRRRNSISIFFPMKKSILWEQIGVISHTGVVYRSDHSVPQGDEFFKDAFEDSNIGSKLRDHWYFYSYEYQG